MRGAFRLGRAMALLMCHAAMAAMNEAVVRAPVASAVPTSSLPPRPRPTRKRALPQARRRLPSLAEVPPVPAAVPPVAEPSAAAPPEPATPAREPSPPRPAPVRARAIRALLARDVGCGDGTSHVTCEAIDQAEAEVVALLIEALEETVTAPGRPRCVAERSVEALGRADDGAARAALRRMTRVLRERQAWSPDEGTARLERLLLRLDGPA